MMPMSKGGYTSEIRQQYYDGKERGKIVLSYE